MIIYFCCEVCGLSISWIRSVLGCHICIRCAEAGRRLP